MKGGLHPEQGTRFWGSIKSATLVACGFLVLTHPSLCVTSQTESESGEISIFIEILISVSDSRGQIDPGMETGVFTKYNWFINRECSLWLWAMPTLFYDLPRSRQLTVIEPLNSKILITLTLLHQSAVNQINMYFFKHQFSKTIMETVSTTVEKIPTF